MIVLSTSIGKSRILLSVICKNEPWDKFLFQAIGSNKRSDIGKQPHDGLSEIWSDAQKQIVMCVTRALLDQELTLYHSTVICCNSEL